MCGSALTVVFLCLFVALSRTDENIGVIEKIKSGFKIAGNLFSSEHASKVANLVSSALGHNQFNDRWTTSKPVNHQDNYKNIFSGFFRLFGLDTRKIGAIAVNALIIVAQLIGNSIPLTPPSQLEQYKEMKNKSPFEWMLNNPAVAYLLENTKDENLSEQVLDYVRERSVDEESGCIQLLICKTSPYIKVMQKIMKNRGQSEMRGSSALLQYFPSAEEVSNNGDDCSKKHNFCSLNL